MSPSAFNPAHKPLIMRRLQFFLSKDLVNKDCLTDQGDVFAARPTHVKGVINEDDRNGCTPSGQQV